MNQKIGVLGGGQLGRMLIQEAVNLNAEIFCIDPAKNAPCKDIATGFTQGDFNEYDAVYQFGKDKDVVTIEIEHVNVAALEQLEKEGKRIVPSPAVLRIVQDKGLQKQFYKENNIPTSNFHLVDSGSKMEKSNVSFPFVMKARTGGYDGKGVMVIKSESDIKNAFDGPAVVEDFVPFEKEISVIVARDDKGNTASFPVVDMEFNDKANLVEFLFSPSNIGEELELKAKHLAEDVANKMGAEGILAVELFLTKNGELLVNEVAPRPHNSGHHTIEGNYTSQYGQLLRVLLNLPLGNTEIRQPAVMLNLLGEEGYTGKAIYKGLDKTLAMAGVYVHLYGKEDTKSFRKMGHITVVNNNLDKAKAIAKEVQNTLKIIAK